MRSLLLVLVASALVLTGCTSSKNPSNSEFVHTDGPVTTVDPAGRTAAPSLKGQDLDGNEVSLADFEGQVVVVNLWGSWCPPCRQELPILASVSKDYSSKNTQFLGLLDDTSLASARATADDAGVTYPSVVDTDGTLQLGFADSLPALGIPTTWIIDENGKVAAQYSGAFPDEQSLSDLIDYANETSA